jgi:hypothetical protein
MVYHSAYHQLVTVSRKHFLANRELTIPLSTHLYDCQLPSKTSSGRLSLRCIQNHHFRAYFLYLIRITSSEVSHSIQHELHILYKIMTPLSVRSTRSLAKSFNKYGRDASRLLNSRRRCSESYANYFQAAVQQDPPRRLAFAFDIVSRR